MTEIYNDILDKVTASIQERITEYAEQGNETQMNYVFNSQLERIKRFEPFTDFIELKECDDPSIEEYNNLFNDLYADFSGLRNGLTVTQEVLENNFNTMVGNVNATKNLMKELYSLLGDLKIYSYDRSAALYFSDSFVNNTYIDNSSEMLSGNKALHLFPQEGIVTLPIVETEDSKVNVSQIIVTKDSNGSKGNNQEIKNGVKTPYNRNELSIADSNPDTIFEYESFDNSSVLVLDLVLVLTEPTVINNIVIDPVYFTDANRPEIETIETSLDGKTYYHIFKEYFDKNESLLAANSLMRLEPGASKGDGTFSYLFSPRLSKFVHIRLKENNTYFIGVGSGSSKLRKAIGLREIYVKSWTFDDKGILVSKSWDTKYPIRKVGLLCTTEGDQGNLIQHQVSLDNGQTWLDLNPLDREDVKVQEIISINTGDSNEIKLDKDIFSIRYKAIMKKSLESFRENGYFALYLTSMLQIDRIKLSEKQAVLDLSYTPLQGKISSFLTTGRIGIPASLFKKDNLLESFNAPLPSDPFKNVKAWADEDQTSPKLQLTLPNEIKLDAKRNYLWDLFVGYYHNGNLVECVSLPHFPQPVNETLSYSGAGETFHLIEGTEISSTEPGSFWMSNFQTSGSLEGFYQVYSTFKILSTIDLERIVNKIPQIDLYMGTNKYKFLHVIDSNRSRYALFGLQSATITLTNNNIDGMQCNIYVNRESTTLTEGVDWTKGADVNASATLLAAEIQSAIPEITAIAVLNVITLTTSGSDWINAIRRLANTYWTNTFTTDFVSTIPTYYYKYVNQHSFSKNNVSVTSTTPSNTTWSLSKTTPQYILFDQSVTAFSATFTPMCNRYRVTKPNILKLYLDSETSQEDIFVRQFNTSNSSDLVSRFQKLGNVKGGLAPTGQLLAGEKVSVNQEDINGTSYDVISLNYPSDGDLSSLYILDIGFPANHSQTINIDGEIALDKQFIKVNSITGLNKTYFVEEVFSRDLVTSTKYYIDYMAGIIYIQYSDASVSIDIDYQFYDVKTIEAKDIWFKEDIDIQTSLKTILVTSGLIRKRRMTGESVTMMNNIITLDPGTCNTDVTIKTTGGNTYSQTPTIKNGVLTFKEIYDQALYVDYTYSNVYVGYNKAKEITPQISLEDKRISFDVSNHPTATELIAAYRVPAEYDVDLNQLAQKYTPKLKDYTLMVIEDKDVKTSIL